MIVSHSLDCKDWHTVMMHGTDISDGDGAAVSGMVKSSFQDIYGKRTHNLVPHLDHKHPQLNAEHQIQYYGEKGLYATTD